MKKKIPNFNWRTELINDENIDRIGDDFTLIDKLIPYSSFEHPFKVDITSVVICTRGTTKGKINLIPYNTSAPCMIIMLPGQILEYEYISEDFDGKFIIMSKPFLEKLQIDERLHMYVTLHENPCIPLKTSELDSIINFYYMAQKIIRLTDNPYRLESIQYLTKAFFYGGGYFFHRLFDKPQKTKNEIMVSNFLNLVQLHYATHRNVTFYAEKMKLTPKYMSTVIKENSGMSAGEWIDNRVILEAKALLKSTNMTIQQISDKLNFPTQSIFGRYFKRQLGVSPKEYRKN